MRTAKQFGYGNVSSIHAITRVEIVVKHIRVECLGIIYAKFKLTSIMCGYKTSS